jgi:hypothetical protein
MDRLAGRAVDKGYDLGATGRWVSAHRTLLAIVVLILGFLVLVLWNNPPLVGVIFVAAVVIVLEGIVLFLARQSDLATRAASAGEIAEKTGD